ncbi:hypothetical protein Ae201684_006021 [Aphanomyces euteiches]|uniref:Uncharacterized protein n=1 Tax=Aphanomyces euteiches TaxID=100861 RepID=A0A6G0XDE6_9STRA|nr:hypothetical protein Ae201684_006021 [Aphanomyces euteiches]
MQHPPAHSVDVQSARAPPRCHVLGSLRVNMEQHRVETLRLTSRLTNYLDVSAHPHARSSDECALRSCRSRKCPPAPPFQAQITLQLGVVFLLDGTNYCTFCIDRRFDDSSAILKSRWNLGNGTPVGGFVGNTCSLRAKAHSWQTALGFQSTGCVAQSLTWLFRCRGGHCEQQMRLVQLNATFSPIDIISLSLSDIIRS